MMNRKKCRGFALTLALTMLSAMLPFTGTVSAATLPYFNHFSTAAEPSFGFDSINDASGKAVYSVVEDAAGHKVLQIHLGGNGSTNPYGNISVSKTDLDKPLAFSFRVKLPNDGGNISIIHRAQGFQNLASLKKENGKEYIDFMGGSAASSAPFTRGEWHDVTIVTDYKEKKGNVFFDKSASQYDVAVNAGAIPTQASTLRIGASQVVNTATDIFYDNIQLYTKQDLTPTIPDKMYPNSNKLEITFNNGMDLAAMTAENISLVKVEGETETPVAGYGISVENLIVPAASAPKCKLTLTGLALEPKQAYKVTFQGIKDIFGQAADPVSFTTEAAMGDPEFTLEVAGGAAVKANSSFTVNGTLANAPDVKEVSLIIDNDEKSVTKAAVDDKGAFTCELTSTGLTPGNHTVTAKIEGANPITSEPLTFTVAENQPPTAEWVLPEADNLSMDVTSGAKTFSVNAADEDGTVQSVAFYDGDTLLATKTSIPYSADLALGWGEHTVKAVVTDNNGASAEITRTVNIKAYKNNQIGETLTFDNYNPADDETAPAELDASDTKGTVKFTNDNGGVKAYSPNGYNNSPGWLGKKFSEPLKGRVAIEGDFLINEVERSYPARQLFGAVVNGKAVMPLYAINSMLTKKYDQNDRTQMLTSISSKKSHIKMVWDLPTGRIDLYLDGKKAAEQIAILDRTPVPSISEWRILVEGSPNKNAYTWMDNLKFYELEEDPSQPEVSSVTLNGSEATENVPLKATGSAFQISFNSATVDEASLKKSGAVTLKTRNDEAVAFTGSYDAAANKYTVTPTGRLLYGEAYTLTVNTSVTSSSGVPLKEAVSKTFSMEDKDFKINGISRTAAKLTGNTDVETTVTVQRKDAGTAVAISALYNNLGVLVDFQTTELTFTEPGEQTSRKMVIHTPADVTGYKLKNFVFDSFTHLMPAVWNTSNEPLVP